MEIQCILFEQEAAADLAICWGEVSGISSLWKPRDKCPWFDFVGDGAA